MGVYLVTWNLNKEGAGYAAARKQLVDRVTAYDHVYDGKNLDTVCFLSTSKSATDVYNHLGQALDVNDRVVITQMFEGSCEGWLSDFMAEWIKARL